MSLGRDKLAGPVWETEVETAGGSTAPVDNCCSRPDPNRSTESYQCTVTCIHTDATGNIGNIPTHSITEMLELESW